jgi:hypothetical protein
MSVRTGLIAKHDGTEYFSIVHLSLPELYYLPVPGGVVMLFGAGSVFIPMCRLEYDLADNGHPTNVHLTSTLAQVMLGSAMAGMAQVFLNPEDGG